MNEKERRKCIHGRDSELCCQCKYGNYGRMRSFEKVRDLTDDFKTSVGYRLVKGFNMVKDWL